MLSQSDQIKRSEERYQSLLIATTQIVWTADAEGNVTEDQPAWRKFTGQRREEVMGQGWLSAVHPEDRERVRALWSQAVKMRQHYVVEYRLRGQDGSYRYFVVNGVPILNSDGSIREWLGACTDITERKQAEALRTGQSHILEMIAAGTSLEDTLIDLMLLIECQARGMLCSVLLLDEDGQHLRRGAAPSLPEIYNRAVDGFQVGPQAGSCGTAVYRRERVIVTDVLTDPLWGKYREFMEPIGLRACWSTPIFSAQNKVLGTFAVYYREPRSPTLAELRLVDLATHIAGIAMEHKRARAELFNSRQMLQLVLDTIPQRVFWKDRNSVYVGCNKPLALDCGYADSNEIRGKTDYETASATMAEIYRADDRRVMETGRAWINYEEPQIKPDGTQGWLTTSKLPLRDQEGRVIGVLGTYEDITVRKQAEEVLLRDRDYLEKVVRARTAELIEAKERAEVANEAKGVFLAKMSHELRTPLNAILGYAQIFQKRDLSCEVMNGLKTIQHSGEHLLTLINDILNLSKIEAGKMELYPTLIHFPAFLEEIAGGIRSHAEERGLTMIYETPTPLPAGVEVDPTRLRQILLNLLDNAVKFTEAGRIVFRVSRLNLGELAERPQAAVPARLRFEIEDTGMGIATDHLEQIFRPFEQAGKATGHIEGTGLGLAISRQLVQLMGGSLQVKSELGRGSRFWFEIGLPVKAAVAEATRLPRRLITGYQGPKRRALVVDDIGSNREVMVGFLQGVGFETVEARDGREGIRLAGEMRPDLILMDLYMPVIDGFEAALRIRQIPELRGVVIIAISASVSEEDQSQSQEAGYDAFLSKPVSWPKLSGLLEKHLKLDWDYSEVKDQMVATTEPGAGKTEALAPPKEELTRLLELARMGDLSAMQERATQLKTADEGYIPFADRLCELAQGFEEQEILHWMEECLEVK